MKKKICVDLDGTLCTNTFGDYKNAKPLPDPISKINEWFDQGHYIIIYTSRFMGLTKGDKKKVYDLGYKFTKEQLSQWNIQYNELIMGKPEYDVIIDDKSLDFSDNWFEKTNF